MPRACSLPAPVSRRKLALCLFLLPAVWVVGGCSPGQLPLEVRYEPAEGMRELSESRQEEIRAALEMYYGTASRPLLRRPSEDSSDGEDGDEIALVDVVRPLQLRHGAEVYRRRCAGCHGVTGNGAGPAAEYLKPKPRDYRPGIFKFTSTPNGVKPVRADLVRVIRRGAKGTSMPSFKFLPDEDVEAVTDYVISLSRRGEVERILVPLAESLDEGDPIPPEDIAETVRGVEQNWEDAERQVVRPLTTEPPISQETIAAGRKAFLSLDCVKCHGKDGEGQTEWLSPRFVAQQEALPEDEREQINRDVWGNVAPAADLTAGTLHGGRRPLDIYHRIYTGINGTPMPAFKNLMLVENEDGTPRDPDLYWHLVHFVLHVSQDIEPEN